MGDKTKGWIKLNRSIRECWLWNIKPVSFGQAWVDMILRCNHEPKKILINGSLTVIDRGSFYSSILKLSNDWGWERRKTKRFLDVLVNDQMITINVTTHGTTVTLVNYEVYQNLCTTNSTTDSTTDGTTDAQQTVQPMHTNKNDKEYKNDKEHKNKHTSYSDEFEKAWAVYPRHDDKGQAYAQYRARIQSGWTDAELISAAAAYAAECNSRRTDKKYIKMGKTFFGASTPFSDYIKKEEVEVDADRAARDSIVVDITPDEFDNDATFWTRT